MYHPNMDVNLLLENETRIKIGIIINVGASMQKKNVIRKKKILFGILLYAVANIVKFRKYYWRFSDYVWCNYRYNKNHSNKYQRKKGNV